MRLVLVTNGFGLQKGRAVLALSREGLEAALRG